MKKTGRNDPCPCGSGRKYKKCCLTKAQDSKDKDLKIEDKLLSTGDFRYLKNKIDLLEDIFSKYNFEDLVKAIYCINISLDNRSALENLLALNTKLILKNEYGTKRINNYDDYTTEDFGEVKLYWRDTTYNVLIGTGHNLVYGVLQFLPQVVKTLGATQVVPVKAPKN